MKKPQIIVTMTSWKHRIHTLALSICDFLDRQSIKPDIFYVWLSKEEFPNMEKDLPCQLLDAISRYNVELKWLDGNEYCYKRWHVYPQHYEDYVVSIDDDCIYSPTMIEDGLAVLQRFPNSICGIWWQFAAAPTYDNDIKIKWEYRKTYNLENWCSANSIIPPYMFPLEALNRDVIEYRSKYAQKVDEAWLIPYFLKNNAIISFISKNTPFRTFSSTQDQALSKDNGENEGVLYTNNEISLYRMLKFSGMIDKYMYFHKGYSYDRFEQTL